MNYTSKNTTTPQNINRLTAIGLPLRNIFISLISFFLLSFFTLGVKAQHINNHKQQPLIINNAASKTAAVITSTGIGGNWSLGATWAGGVVPSATEDVTIVGGATVTVDVNTAALGSLNVLGTLIYETGTARTVTINGDVTIASGGTFKTGVANTNISTHSLIIGGNLTNNGTLNFSTYGGPGGNTPNLSGALITFTGATDASFDCSNATLTNLRQTGGVTLNKGTSNSTLLNFTPGGTFTVQSANTSGFLSITNGTFKIIGSNAFSNPVFNTGGTYSIPTNGGIWLNNSNATVVGQAGSVNNNGLFNSSKYRSSSTLNVFLQSLIMKRASLSKGSFLEREKSLSELQNLLNSSLLEETMVIKFFNSLRIFTFTSNMGLQLVLRFDTSKLYIAVLFCLIP